MMTRFSGDEGRAKLIEVLRKQDIIAGDTALAERLASVGKLEPFSAGQTICEQNGEDDDVFFILSGSVKVFVNHQHLVTREKGTVVGEMAAIDHSAGRSATLKAADDVVTFKVSAAEFLKAGEDAGPFWRRVAQLAFGRLRERSRFHLPANPTPKMFVGSSAEGLALVHELPAAMKHDKVIVRAWTTSGVFGASQASIDDLLARVEESDFALFVFGPDDTVQSRGQAALAPRDNVVFELGLFMGRLGKDRVFIVKDASVDLKIPSDLTGVNPITYVWRDGCTWGDIASNVGAELRGLIAARGAITTRMKMVP